VNLDDIVAGLPRTILTYQGEPYAFEAPSTVLRAEKEQGSNFYLVLSSTIFHPKGGGQPSDVGTVAGEGFTMQVKKALKAGDHVVLYGKCAGTPSPGAATQTIDGERRRLYMRRHAAAHLFDGVLTKAAGRAFEPLDSWLGDDPYVGYQGEPPGEEVMKTAENLANQAIAEGRDVEVHVVQAGDLSGYRHFWASVLQDQLEFRLVTIKGFDPIPCGGTHVKSLSEVKAIRVSSIERTPDGFRIHFEVG
jgi:alanyl-tRNA synthetase